MTFFFSTLLALWLTKVFFEILKGIAKILLACLAIAFASMLYALTAVVEIFAKILRTAFSS